jgi:purine-nucleoside phosphorylase/ribosomal protein S18 acetylase RimI-like enzyme
VLKELTKADWLRILNLPEGRIPAVLIVRGTRNFRRQSRAMRPFFANVIELGTPNGIIEDVLIGDVAGWPVAFACVYGASMASEVVHLFGRLGSRAVIQIGNCGALADGFAAGDLFVAEEAYCGEGASGYYTEGDKWVQASEDLLGCSTLAKLPAGNYRTGTIYTTAALFAESSDDLERWARSGFDAVDLETAATYSAAEHFGMDALSLLYGFDNPRQGQHLLLSDLEKDARRRQADAAMKRLALDLALELCAKFAAGRNAPPRGHTIRDCRLDEVEAVLGLWREAGATVSSTDTERDLHRAVADGPTWVLVAEHQGRLIGSVIGAFDGWRGNIYRLAVHPGHRRQGVAQALLVEVEGRLREQGAKRITALVETGHADAVGFWSAVGYQIDGRIGRFARTL